MSVQEAPYGEDAQKITLYGTAKIDDQVRAERQEFRSRTVLFQLGNDQ